MNIKPETPNCPVQLLPEFLTESLSDIQNQSIEQHLETCERCRVRLEHQAAGSEFWSTVTNLSDDELDREFVGAELGHPGLKLACADPLLDLDEIADHRDKRLRAVFESIKPLLAPSDDPQSAGRIGNYEVTGLVGSGGMGVVLKAKDKSLERVVAIKMLAPHLATFETSRKRFSREAKAAAAVKHDGIISIHGVDSHDGVPYFVMPYEAGPSLQQRIEKSGRLSVEETLRVAAQIADALEAAHQTGLVHRDIKPSNILLAPGTERALLSDFGLAQVCDQQNITQTGLVAGTPMFMSPEQARGESVDSRSDLFSLGSVMFIMLTGKPPISGENSYSIVRHIGGQPMPSLREFDSTLPAWMEKLVGRLHQIEPNDRLQSAADLSRLLNQALAHVHNPGEHGLPKLLQQVSRPSGLVAASSIIGLLLVATLAFAIVLYSPSWFRANEGPNLNQEKSRTQQKQNSAHAPNDEIETMQESELNDRDQPTIEVQHESANPSAAAVDDWDDGLDVIIQDIQNRLEQIELDDPDTADDQGDGVIENENQTGE